MSNNNAHEKDRVGTLLRDAEVGLEAFAQSRALHASADARLAFRELGLSIGIQANSRIQRTIEQHPAHFSNSNNLQATLAALKRFHPLANDIEDSWLDPLNQRSPGWTAHRDINSVMLATSLAPDGYLILQ